MVRLGWVLIITVPWISGCGDGVLGFDTLDEGGGSDRLLTLVKVHTGTYSTTGEAFNWSGDVLGSDGLGAGLSDAPSLVSDARTGGPGAVFTTDSAGLRARMDFVFDASSEEGPVSDFRVMRFSAFVKGGSRTTSCAGGAVDPDADGFEVRFWWPGKPQGWSNSSSVGEFSAGAGIQILLQNVPGSDVEPNQALYSVPPYPSAMIVSVRSTGDAPAGGCSVLAVLNAQLEISP